MELAATESANTPKRYILDMSKDFVPMSVFSESSQGKPHMLASMVVRYAICGDNALLSLLVRFSLCIGMTLLGLIFDVEYNLLHF